MTQKGPVKKLKKIDYLMMLAFFLAILLALVGAVVSSGIIRFEKAPINQPSSKTPMPKVPDAEGKFCGGLGANLPENQCPSGYRCQLDGSYPDAGGKCVSN